MSSMKVHIGSVDEGAAWMGSITHERHNFEDEQDFGHPTDWRIEAAGTTMEEVIVLLQSRLQEADEEDTHFVHPRMGDPLNAFPEAHRG